jgi:hypothetical protein
MQKEVAACPKDDNTCMTAALQRLGTQLQGQTKPAAPDYTRYQAWGAEEASSCATGSASIHETMEGIQLSDRGPLTPIAGSRDGETKLPSKQSWRESCDTLLSFDRQTGTYAIRIGGLNISIPGIHHIQFKGAGKSQPFQQNFQLFEYTDVSLPSYALTLKGLKGTPENLVGSTTLPGKAPKETRSGNIVVKKVPQVITRIEWRLVLD